MGVLKKIKKVIGRIIRFLVSVKCPECGGDMVSDKKDPEYNYHIYTCTKCGKKWIGCN